MLTFTEMYLELDDEVRLMNTTAILNYYETTEGRIKNCSSEFALFF